MARARNLKPGFFTHEDMSENDPLGRLLFLGLTTIADYKGDLEWRPKRLKVQLLPYDECSIESLAINLDKSGFVRFYSDGDRMYLHIVNFQKHQNPHKNERDAGSEIPEFSDGYRQLVDLQRLTIKTELVENNLDEDGATPADSLIPLPDSLIPHPPSLELHPEAGAVQQAASAPKLKRKSRLPTDFDPTASRINAAIDYWKTKSRMDLDAAGEFQKFINHFTANGKPMADWDACWRTWYTNAVQFNRPPLAVVGRQAGQARSFSDIDYTQGASADGTF